MYCTVCNKIPCVTLASAYFSCQGKATFRRPEAAPGYFGQPKADPRSQVGLWPTKISWGGLCPTKISWGGLCPTKISWGGFWPTKISWGGLQPPKSCFSLTGKVGISKCQTRTFVTHCICGVNGRLGVWVSSIDDEYCRPVLRQVTRAPAVWCELGQTFIILLGIQKMYLGFCFISRICTYALGYKILMY